MSTARRLDYDGYLWCNWSLADCCVHLGGVDVVLQGVDEEVTDRLPGPPYPLPLVQRPGQLLHGSLQLQQPLQRELHVPVAVEAARRQLLPQVARHVRLLPHRAAGVLDPPSGRHIWKVGGKALEKELGLLHLSPYS